MNDAELVEAWERWDRFPASQPAVTALERAIANFTDVDRLKFRRFMAQQRRDHRLAYQLILDLWRETHGDHHRLPDR